ncbi:MAG: hypothetical protein HC904_01975 [Blastochloris sp.]|nr:hypothetical protein [Blastochloris sp.]
MVEGGRIQAWELQGEGGSYRIEAGHYVLAAGQGNEALGAELTGVEVPLMQRRPLHQVCVKKVGLKPFYGVALGSSTKPPLVVTTHYDRAGVPVWYLGGDLAETGLDCSEEEQIGRARALLEKLLPWVDWSGAEWRTHRVHRAEAAHPGGHRPPGVYCAKRGNAVMVWPSKLALAPALSDEVLKALEKPKAGGGREFKGLEGWASPPLPEPLWDRLFS